MSWVGGLTVNSTTQLYFRMAVTDIYAPVFLIYTRFILSPMFFLKLFLFLYQHRFFSFHSQYHSIKIINAYLNP